MLAAVHDSQCVIFRTHSSEFARHCLANRWSPVPAKILQTLSAESSPSSVASRFPLPWSGYVLLLSVMNMRAREFYEAEALRGEWSVRQLDPQINSQFFERTALSKNTAAILTKGRRARSEDHVLPEEEIQDPFVLEFLNFNEVYRSTNGPRLQMQAFSFLEAADFLE